MQTKEKKSGLGTAFAEKKWIAYLTVCRDHVKKHDNCSWEECCKAICKATSLSFTFAGRVASLYRKNPTTNKTANAAYKEFAAKYYIRINQSKVPAKKCSKASSSTAHKNVERRILKRKRILTDVTSKQSRKKKTGKRCVKDEFTLTKRILQTIG